MQGKGWFVIYGVLLFTVSYLFFAQQKTTGEIKDIRADVTRLQEDAGGSTETVETASPTPQPTPSPNMATPQGRDMKRKADLGTIAAALAEYRSDKAAYPAGLRDLQPAYLDAVPNDPIQAKYSYRYTRTSTGYVLTAVLESKGDPDDTAGDAKADGVYTKTGRL